MDSEMLGRVISTARKQKNLSQKELGDLLNVSNKAVSKWENGEATPRSETLIKLCDILELNKIEILGFEQKYDSKEIDSLKSENSKLKNQIESINKKQKKALKYIFVVAICFVIFAVAVSFLISKNSSQNSNIDDISQSGTKIVFADNEFIPIYKELEFTLNHEFDFSACEQKYATYITKDGKKKKVLIYCDAYSDFVMLKAGGKNYYYSNEKINYLKCDKKYIENHHEGIISRKMWNMAQAELQRRSVDKSTKKKYSNRYWCSGKIICSECGSRFVIRKSKKKSGIYITWACHERTAHGNKKLDKNNNQIGCNMRTVNNKSLLTCMKFITEQIDVDINNIADDILNEINNSADTSEDNTQNLTLQIQDIQNKKMRMLDSYYSGDINKDEMTALKDKYDKEIEKINAILQKQQNNQTAIQERQNNTDELRNIIINAVCSENVYGEIVDKIIVYDDYMLVKLKYIDFAFKIKYSTHGYMEKYTTVIESCEIVSF